ncbi:MAG: lysoplasmalogenase [Segniliparus sp.]|uniref:lysoplasmalogenase n=1 Tax=Segniliparus sp. TaxID=2804064 RepID=UPI003F4145D2
MALSFKAHELSAVLRGFYAGAAVADTALSAFGGQQAHRTRRFTKPLLMPVLAASFAANPSARRSPLFRAVLLAQAASWCGDVALLGDAPRDFARGAASFAAGHASYIAGMRPHRAATPGAPAKAVAGIWAVCAPGVALAAGREAPYLAPILLGYSAALAGTAASATTLSEQVPAAARRRMAAGGLAFLASDAVLGLRRFLWQGAPQALEAVVMATYLSAQYLIADGAARAAART